MAEQYDLARDANAAYRRMRMNVKYYGCRLAVVKLHNAIVEGIIAVGASGAIASTAAWNYPGGKVAFAILALAAAVLGVAKPFLGYADKISRYSKLWSSYNSLHHSLERITRDMRLHRQLRPEMEGALSAALEEFASLANDEDASPDKKLQAKCTEEVESEIPPGELWWPAGCDPSNVTVSA